MCPGQDDLIGLSTARFILLSYKVQTTTDMLTIITQGSTFVCTAAALLVAIWVYRTRQTAKPPPALPANALPSLVLPCITSHRRFLPTTSIHSFSYPLTYLGLDLESLESGSLDLPTSRGFVYGGNPWCSILGIQSRSYLDVDATPKRQPAVSFRKRLLGLLERNGVKEHEVGRVWLLTMPSYLGKAGINPLTTYFVYRNSDEKAADDRQEGKDGGLLCVVLEVHNTFEERYVRKSFGSPLPLTWSLTRPHVPSGMSTSCVQV